MPKGTLHILPNLLGQDANPHESFVPSIKEAFDGVDGIIAEHAKPARALFKHFDKKRLLSLPILECNKRTDPKELNSYLDPIVNGENWALVSDCGVACIADPGARLVELAHKRSINVKAHVGPSSILLALMLSGMYAQRFTFLGYLPRRDEDLKKILSRHETKIFIETPYKNVGSIKRLLGLLRPSDRLCIAADLMLPTQLVLSRAIKEFKTVDLELFHRKPAVFVVS